MMKTNNKTNALQGRQGYVPADIQVINLVEEDIICQSMEGDIDDFLMDPEDGENWLN